MYRNLNSLAEGTGRRQPSLAGLHTRVNCFITQFQDQHQVDILSLRLNGQHWRMTYTVLLLERHF